jgi:tol-pal system protein YbgF
MRAVLIPCWVAACAVPPREAREQQLAVAFDELRGQLRDQRARLEELSNRVFVLADRLDSAQVLMSRPATPPALEVVKLVPDVEAAPEPGVADRESVVIQVSDNGELEALPVQQVPPPPRARQHANRGAEEAFRDALAAYRRGEIEDAYRLFARFRERFSHHAYADNALYWMGECRYDAKEYREAIGAFADVIKRHPRSNKVPDALLKLGLAYERLGQVEMAKKAFEDIISGYPGSAMADLARTHLAALVPPGGSR